ncbi:TPA: TcpQ domain-containing protein [Salmonella enterica subsp. diarizonae serovar 60-67:z35:-]
MKVKTIFGIVLMALSSLSVAKAHSVNDLSRSPFQVDRDKVRAQTESPVHLHPDQSPVRGNSIITPPAADKTAVSHSVWQAETSTYLILTLQENHLLSQDIVTWAKSQGMHPLWNSKRDYLIYSTIKLSGKNRDEVLNQLGQLFCSENYGLVVRLYEKNNVLVIDGQ